MQYKVLDKVKFLGSSAEKDKVKSVLAFSLAEMLIVFLIMSFIAIGIPLIHFKKTELKTRRSLHGRYECYYQGNTLMQYTVNEDGAKTGPEAVTECKFTPPRNAIFFLVHAVGGGGGASNAAGTGSAPVTTDGPTVYNASQVNNFPEWAKNAMGAGYLDGMSAPYTLTRTGALANINYGHSGSAGKTMSMFFPNLANVQVVMQPGIGGNLGQAGSSTTVSFYSTDRDNPSTTTELLATLEAEGGAGGSGSGQMSLWLDGEASLCDIKELASRKFKEADFSENIEMDYDTNMDTQLTANDILAGSGGAGAYYNPSPGTVTYMINGVSIPSDVVKKPTCENPSQCDDKSLNTNCPAQAGKNGAVVILW